MSDNVLTCSKEVLGKHSPIKKHLTFDEVIIKGLNFIKWHHELLKPCK